MELNKRYRLDELDRLILKLVKQTLTHGIQELKKRNVRHANIEIELWSHIKKELNGE